MCARFAITRGPGERVGRRRPAESGKTYLGAIYLGPRIIAKDSPEDMVRYFGDANPACGAFLPLNTRADRAGYHAA